MTTHRVTLIPGDDSGPELVAAAVEVVELALAITGSAAEWDVRYAGRTAADTLGDPLPPDVVPAIRDTGVALKGPLTTPVGSGFRSVNAALRRRLDLYACVRPCRLLPGIETRFPPVDVVVVRENTEDYYAGLELEAGSHDAQRVVGLLSPDDMPLTGDCGVSVKLVSEFASERIARFAVDYASRTGRRRITCATRHDALPTTDGLFGRTFARVARSHPELDCDERLLEDVCRDLVSERDAFDVILLPNLYGDVVSDVTAALVGGLGVAPSANLGPAAAIFEATHGSAPRFRGTNTLNPTALMLAGAMMLCHIGEPDAAALVESSIEHVTSAGRVLTFDVAPTARRHAAATTTEFTSEVLRAMKELA